MIIMSPKSNTIPGPGHGPLEGAVETHGTQAIGPAGRPANTCATCSWFYALSPGHAAICGEKWRHLPWHAAVPLTSADETCDKHEARDERHQ
jgi:hypothetical protein